MSLEFEYRRLAGAYLDLAKRAVVLGDKKRLLLIAEAWLNLADRVTRKDGNSKRRNGGSAEHPLVASIFSGNESVG
jgi:hypothetical protein